MSLLSVLLSLFGCSAPTPDDEWAVATGEDNGKSMIVRFRSSVPSGVATEEYPHLIAISWKYTPANEGGMPSKADNDRMVLLEDLLQVLEEKRVAFLTVSVTCNGVKEWQWYSRDHAETLKELNAALSGHPPFPIEIIQQHDPQWSAYSNIKESVQ